MAEGAALPEAPRLGAEMEVACEGPREARYDEPLSVKVRLSLQGELREAFTPSNWERAHELYDEHFTLRYTLSLYLKRPIAMKRLAGPVKLKRRATFYWTRDPLRPYRIWVMVIDESGTPRLPESVDEARSLLMDLEWTFTLAPGLLKRGERALIARASARWGRHSFAEKGSVSGSSRPLLVRIT
jgi:hypothetical protein